MPNAQPAPTAPCGRPFALDPLFRGLQTLSGVGPKSLPLLEKLLGGARIVDLLFHAPIDMIDRSYAPDLHSAIEGKVATITVTVEEHKPPKRDGLPYRIVCTDGVGWIDCVFFNVRGNYLEQQFPTEGNVTISGKLERFSGKWQMAHPDIIAPGVELPQFEPIYAMTAGITHKMINKFVTAALPAIPDLPEWHDSALLAREKWPDFARALYHLHRPEGEDDLNFQAPHRRRLAYDELLADQLTISLLRDQNRGLRGRAFLHSGKLSGQLRQMLPFQLTGAQERILSEIATDMAAPTRMMRLLQGDVGSGKTIVAALAMLQAIENGAQAALMVPTEILAQQHAKTLAPLMEKIGVRVVVLTGRHKGTDRDQIITQIANGTAQMIIGTHAIFQDTVDFKDLGLAVIDEQHRFGVHQRLLLSGKGVTPDMLVMTATPIPRTLALTAYGDLDVSQLNEKPPGRLPVDTRLIPLPRLADIIDRLPGLLAQGTQIYWVCPLVEESEILDLAAAEGRFDELHAQFGDQVGLIHGRMRVRDKDAVMSRFVAGEVKILVATTVIEVGVNVPAATMMVIEHAERFGLAQLHQLRGRVGRGGAQSYCFLLYHPDHSAVAKERLKIMRETEDGFLIAERDLELRGPGDILGTKQSGVPEFRLADLGAHADLLSMARDDARLLVSKDRKLQSPRGQALRHLLYLFERDQAIKLLYSG